MDDPDTIGIGHIRHRTKTKQSTKQKDKTMGKTDPIENRDESRCLRSVVMNYVIICFDMIDDFSFGVFELRLAPLA